MDANQIITINDLYLVPIYIILVLLFANLVKSKWIKKYPEYKYFVYGLVLKLIGVSFFLLIYLYYYGGGDTVSYFLGSRAILNLLIQDFDKGLAVLFNLDSPLNTWNSFNQGTTYPPAYIWRDEQTFTVCRYTVPLLFLGSKSFIITSFFTSILSYLGTWKLFRLFNIIYKGHTKHFAYIILFMPSLLFWGSGIMKDSYVIGATCWISYNFYKLFILRKDITLNLLLFVFNSVVIISVKSYVIISLIPGMLIWLNNSYLISIKNTFLKILTLPVLSLIIIGLGFFTFNNLSSLLGVYGDVDSAIEQAQIIRSDLLRSEQYGTNNYDIGKFDGSFSGLIATAPIAIFTALFRPLIFEIGSPTMFLSAIENTILLIFTIYILVRTSPIRLFSFVRKEPFLFYCFIFSFLFAFGVGIAGTNFGALVRYKTPLIPFFFPAIYIVNMSRKDN